MLEGILTRGDRRVAAALEAAWRRGARLDAWSEYFNPRLWWETFADLGIDVPFYSHRERPIDEVLPWDHIHIKFGREYLAKEQNRSVRAARGRWPGRCSERRNADSNSPILIPDQFEVELVRGVESMATATTTKLMTAEEFMAADLGEGTSSWFEGRFVEVPPAMPEHGRVCGNVVFVLETYGRQSGLGYALSNDSAVLTERDPDTVRGADVCFYSHARWPRAEVGNRLAAGAAGSGRRSRLSRKSTSAAIMKKVAEYLGSGRVSRLGGLPEAAAVS